MDVDAIHVLLLSKNFAATKGISHIGLGVSALLTAKYLQNNCGIRATAVGIVNPEDIRTQIARFAALNLPVTHVVVSAPWIPTLQYMQLCADFPQVHFVMNCHSNLGFLQADANGAQLFREALDLQQGTINFRAAANTLRFRNWVQTAYRTSCQLLPNLYWTDPVLDSPERLGWPHTGGTLRIGVFGALRAQKNVITNVGACLEIAASLKTPVEIWLSTNREDDTAAQRILAAAQALTRNVPGVTLVSSPWQPWPGFVRVVDNKHLLITTSYTESFNIVVADGISRGVPSVISDAIDWAPQQWQAHADDAHDVATVGLGLIGNIMAPKAGTQALWAHNHTAAQEWLEYLTTTPPMMPARAAKRPMALGRRRAELRAA